MKVAIIGSKGQLGSDLVKVFDKSDVIPLTHDQIEVKDYTSCKKIIDLSPDVVINTAAFHKTDDCEDNPLETFKVNAIGSKNVADVCKRIKAVYVYISTDYVFDGEKGAPYTEDDTPNPINTYGISKLAGEHYAKLAEKYYIIRVSSLFGKAGASGKGGNFVETMIKKAKNKEKITVVDDMIMSPTYTKDAARAIKKIIEEDLPYGIYHASNSGFCSWYEFARKIFELLNLDVDIKPIKTKDLTLRAKRPVFSALESKRLSKYGLKIPNWQKALRDYLHEKGYLLA
ncbi:dTDP-4-dehydrorhamnose reductase [Candidatus Aerophobetes bacterium]|nr:dTDP-4-dehydrorhamnose reductase [Candidatus Aerophobetes bacterium]